MPYSALWLTLPTALLGELAAFTGVVNCEVFSWAEAAVSLDTLDTLAACLRADADTG